MLEAANTSPIDASGGADASDSVQVPRALIAQMEGELKLQRAKIEALNFEIAKLKRWRFDAHSERMQVDTQAVLFDQIVADTQLEDAAAQDDKKTPASTPPRTKGQAVRQALPANLPRIDHHHEIEQTHCACGQPFKRIGQEVSEKLDCVPTQFFVHRHIRGKYACACCQTIQAAPMPAQIIDKGIPAPGLMAQVMIAKHDDHLPLYRLEEIFARSGVHIPRSSMAQWVGIGGVRLTPVVQALREHLLGQDVIHADETPMPLLAPGRGKTKRAYVWVYRSTNYVKERAVLFDFAPGRGGEHARRVLEGFGGTLVTDDYSGYHKLHAQGSVTAQLCMAHARRKLFEVHKLNGSQIAAHAVALIAKLYEVEREAQYLDTQERWRLRQQRSKPIAEELHRWLVEQRQRLANADATAKAIDYSLSNWRGLTHYLDDGDVPIDNNAAENAVRPLVIGRKNYLFVGSVQAGERAAAILSLIESAKLNGHDPWVYLKDVLERLPTTKQRDIAQLLPHNWRPAGAQTAAAATPTTATA